jgi:hypothetical protein
MKRAVIKCVVQMVLALQDRQHPEQKKMPKKALKPIQSARVEPESVSEVSTFSSESSAAEEKGFHCLFGNLAEPEETEPKFHFYYERVPGVSCLPLTTEGTKQPYFLDEEGKGDSVERDKLTVSARQHVERVGPGSSRTGHPRLEAPSRLRTAALWGSRAELLPLGPRSAAPSS